MRLLLILGIMFIVIIILLCISFKTFLKDNPSVGERLSKKYGSDWKEKLLTIFYDKTVCNDMTDDDQELLELLLDEKEFERSFDMLYDEKMAKHKPYHDLFIRCDTLLKK